MANKKANTATWNAMVDAANAAMRPTVVNVEVQPSRCIKPACASTRRTDYHHIVSHRIEGDRDGKPHNLVVWRRTECLDCGQGRVDISYEYHPKG